MKLSYWIFFVLILPTSIFSQGLTVSIERTGGGCDGPDTLTALVEVSSTGFEGDYFYTTFDHSCPPPDTLMGTVSIEEIVGLTDNNFRFTDFSFGVWELCYSIDPPAGSLAFTYENNVVGNISGSDDYGDTWNFDSFEKDSNSYVVTYSNSYSEFATGVLVPTDGRTLPSVNGEQTIFSYLWSTGETTPTIEALDEGTYTVIVTDSNGNGGSASVELMFADAFPDVPGLVALYNSLDGPNWTENDGWKEAAEGTEICNPCLWSGIRCFGGPRVNWIDLGNNNLTGSIPAEIAGISELRILDLNDNNISGNLPMELTNLNRLSRVNINRNNISGNIPEYLGDMLSLRSISMAENNLSGPIPTAMGNLQDLESLDFSGNALDGNIPQIFGNMDMLENITLFGNQLTGTIPENIGTLPNLEGLYLSFNNLTGTIPSSLASNNSLEELYLSYNQLEGALPDSLFLMNQLVKLYIDHNNLSGCYPEAKDSICMLPQVTSGFVINIGGVDVEVFFEDGYNLLSNPLLPWSGDLEKHCNGEDQIGAPCDAGNRDLVADTINADCECVSDGTATHELNGFKIDVYPNPFVESLYITVDKSSNLQAAVFDIEGRKVTTLEINRENKMEQLPSGVYVLKVFNSEKEFISERIIKL